MRRKNKTKRKSRLPCYLTYTQNVCVYTCKTSARSSALTPTCLKLRNASTERSLSSHQEYHSLSYLYFISINNASMEHIHLFANYLSQPGVLRSGRDYVCLTPRTQDSPRSPKHHAERRSSQHAVWAKTQTVCAKEASSEALIVE